MSKYLGKPAAKNAEILWLSSWSSGMNLLYPALSEEDRDCNSFINAVADAFTLVNCQKLYHGKSFTNSVIRCREIKGKKWTMLRMDLLVRIFGLPVVRLRQNCSRGLYIQGNLHRKLINPCKFHFRPDKVNERDSRRLPV